MADILDSIPEELIYYRENGIVIINKDCRLVLPHLPKVDLVLTDPPYIHQHIDGGGFERKARFYAERRLEDISSFDFAAYIDFLAAASDCMVAFHSRDLIFYYATAANQRGLKYDLHVWHKNNAVPFTANTWKSDIEYISLIWSRKPGWVQKQESEHSKVYKSNLEINRQHPAQKPIPLLKKYIEILDAQTILDPFMGSGTTGVACKQLGRKFIGIEIEQKYCDIAIDRLRQEVLPLNQPESRVMEQEPLL